MRTKNELHSEYVNSDKPVSQMMLQELLKTRAACVGECDVIVSACETEHRNLTAEEDKTYNRCIARVREIDTAVKLKQHQNTLKVISGNGGGHVLAPVVEETPTLDRRFLFPGTGEFISSGGTEGRGVIRASLTEGGDLQHVVPSYEVRQFLAAYPSNDPFRAAGADIVDLDGGWTDAKHPIVVAGADPSDFSEGDGPDTDQPASIYVASLDTPAKTAFLTKSSEEAIEDIATLGAVITQEGIRRITAKITKKVTAALLTSLASASATVAQSAGDNYQDLLAMIAAIPLWAASPTNKWMGSRRTRQLLANTRVGSDNLPVFTPDLSQLLSYPFVVNDAVPAGKLLFGDFSAVHIRRAAFHFQLINEAYRETGQVGFRFYQRSKQAFFSDAANASQSEQPLVMMTSDLGC